MKQEKSKIKFTQDICLQITLDDIILQLTEIKDALEKKGITECWLDIDSGYSNYTTSIKGYRLETDEEYNKRIELTESLKNKEKESRRKQYEKLRKEFEG
jgi:putative ubiquitin-RnfH superfamily antitoxin RatB of RatAB toxin-antitoxin module